jgi:xanthine/uracil/vitamin C permease (AzgA family)
MSDLTPEQRKAERLAKLFDLRSFIGSLFVVFGVIVTITGLTASQAEIDKAAGINLSLWIGLLMLALGIFFVIWMLASPPEVLHGHEVSEEDLPEQLRGEHLLGGH